MQLRTLLQIGLITLTTLASLNSLAGEVLVQTQITEGDEHGPKLTFIADDTNPDSVIIAFAPRDDAAVNQESFRIRYGLFGLDVTDEFLEHGELNDQQVTVSRSLLEPGKYRITVEVGDTLQRRTVMKMRLLVTEAAS